MAGQESPFPEVASARKFCAGTRAACQSIRLYPATHPNVGAAAAALMALLDSHLTAFGDLVLKVEEDFLFCKMDHADEQLPGTGELAILMFREGIRTLSFRRGVESWELEAVVDCLAHVDQYTGTDRDLVTALWERELLHVDYEVVDPFLQGAGQNTQALEELRAIVLRRMDELTTSGGSGPPVSDSRRAGSSGLSIDAGLDGAEPPDDERSVVNPRDVVLDERELELSERLVAEQNPPIADFIPVVLEVLGDASGSSDPDEAVVRALDTVVARCLQSGDTEALELIKTRLEDLEARGRRTGGFCKDVFVRAATVESMTGLVVHMGSAPVAEATQMEQFVRRLGSWVHPVLLEVLATSDDRGVRRTLLDLLGGEGGIPVEALLPLMADPRWYVVRNAVRLAARADHPELARYLERSLHHGDVRVRREVVRSLNAVAAPRSLPLLIGAMRDEDSSVRILALRGLAKCGTRRELPLVKADLKVRGLEARSVEEVEAVLGALARLGGEEAFDTLNRLWRRRWFGSRPPMVRLAALRALGTVASPAARQVLSEAARSRDAAVRWTAVKALGGPESD